ncbi:MAG: tRNA1(Val) (adenine(37)-N6)-methyltransferase [Runella sp.]
MPRIKQPYFDFKQFRVWHDRSALKVCTESCILGAYVNVQNATRVLDIGTGTGLLALMMAQRNPFLQIDAVELEADAAAQAAENVEKSPFHEQIKVYHTAIQDWQPSERYDLIVSNPPFFDHHLLSPNADRNRTLHTQTLPFEDLGASVNQLLASKGRLVLLLPPLPTRQIRNLLASYGWYQTQQLQIFQRPYSPIFRLITTFEQSTEHRKVETMTIYDEKNSYSDDFRQLLQPYYLIF